MNDKSGTQLWLEPRSLWRHNLSAVGDVHDLLHSYRIKCQSPPHLTIVDTALQLLQSSESTNKVDALVGTEVLYTHELVEDKTAGNVDIEYTDRIGVVVSAGLALRLYHSPSR